MSNNFALPHVITTALKGDALVIALQQNFEALMSQIQLSGAEASSEFTQAEAAGLAPIPAGMPIAGLSPLGVPNPGRWAFTFAFLRGS